MVGERREGCSCGDDADSALLSILVLVLVEARLLERSSDVVGRAVPSCSAMLITAGASTYGVMDVDRRSRCAWTPKVFKRGERVVGNNAYLGLQEPDAVGLCGERGLSQAAQHPAAG